MTVQELLINFFMNITSGFIANFYSTLIAGTALGIVGGYIISKKLNSEERKKAENSLRDDLRQKEIDKQKNTTQMRILFLELLQKEILDISEKTNIFLEVKEKANLNSYPYLKTNSWDLLKYSGEITNIFDVHMLHYLTTLYFFVENVNVTSNHLAIYKNSNNPLPEVNLEKELFSNLDILANILLDKKALDTFQIMIDGYKEKLSDLKT